MVVHTSETGTREVEAGKSGGLGHLLIHREFYNTLSQKQNQTTLSQNKQKTNNPLPRICFVIFAFQDANYCYFN